MTITVIYRSEVQIPESFYREWGHTPEYERAVLKATKGTVSGTDLYSGVYEWAETHDPELAKQVEVNLKRIANGDLT